MRFALAVPRFEYDGSIYFGCRERHLPLEMAYGAAALQSAGHEALVFDAGIRDLDHQTAAREIAGFLPDVVVIETAPTYLFWRCCPPELRSPARLAREVKIACKPETMIVAVGPHASMTPFSTMEKLDADAAVAGEFENLLPAFGTGAWRDDPRVSVLREKGKYRPRLRETFASADVSKLPPLSWSGDWLFDRPFHHHHRFDLPPGELPGPGAEVEASRGCPFACAFCAKEAFRGVYRRRPTPAVIREIDCLLEQGAAYIYFIDEIFQPRKTLLEALARRPVSFGAQLRIDLWTNRNLELLGKAGCVSIEAGVEAVTVAGRRGINKMLRIPVSEVEERLRAAKSIIPFVQANLVRVPEDDPSEVLAWRDKLRDFGVWANDPVPVFPYPGSPEYRSRFGPPDEEAYSKAARAYLSENKEFCDLQDQHPLDLSELEGK